MVRTSRKADLLQGKLSNRPLHKVTLIGNYLPRQCGIATFTTDTRAALHADFPNWDIDVFAMNDGTVKAGYPPEVTGLIRQHDPDSYRDAAQRIMQSGSEVIWLQHEYGIFGGPAGALILDLLDETQLPLVVTLHTVLTHPNPDQERVMKALLSRASFVIVMADKGRDILLTRYDVDPDRIAVIPHGIADIALTDAEAMKVRFGFSGRQTLLTFGLLSPNKGLENMIAAMPHIIRQHPHAQYIILGATHPHLLAANGDVYRQSLIEKAEALGVGEAVLFIDSFVEPSLLLDYLAATDVYVTPYLNEAQITSGTLAYAMGAGRAIVSTPYWHAAELLADGHGVLVPFGNVDALAQAVIALLDDEEDRHEMQKRAYARGREMVWPRVTERAVLLLEEAIASGRRAVSSTGLKLHPKVSTPVPEAGEANSESVRANGSKSALRPGAGDQAAFAAKAIADDLIIKDAPHAVHALIDTVPSFAAIERMTDDCGIVQHGSYRIADRHHGYCLDDNARALMMAVGYLNALEDDEAEASVLAKNVMNKRMRLYASFVHHAWNEENRCFRNFMGYDRRWLEARGSHDSNGRALWALGVVAGASKDCDMQDWARGLFDQAAYFVLEHESPRAHAYSAIGAAAILGHMPEKQVARRVAEQAISILQTLYAAHKRENWFWFEPVFAYDNARLAEALLRAGAILNDEEALSCGIEALEWLCTSHFVGSGHFRAIGSDNLNNALAFRMPELRFDQQPLEALAMIEACEAAFIVTGNVRWKERAEACFCWYHGFNDGGRMMITPDDGGCYDGLTATGVNRNQGAESILSYHMAWQSVRRIAASVACAERSGCDGSGINSAGINSEKAVVI